MRRFALPFLVLALALGLVLPAAAQTISVDRGVRMAGLWCFPTATNPKEYVYLPTGGHLGTDAKGGPEFSFLRYVENSKAGGEGAATVTDAGGGGVLQFLALYGTPPAQIAQAEKALQQTDPEARLRGPITFTAGRYSVISSVVPGPATGGATPAEGGSRKMVGSGNAPVLEGSKIAVSFGLNRRDASILYQSFSTANPDVSVVFEMQFTGVSETYDAVLDVDWTEVQKDRQIQAGIKTPWIGVDVQTTMQRLVRNNAIRVTSRGENAPTEALLNAVYGRIVELLFRKTDEPPPPPAPSGEGLSGLLEQAKSKILTYSLTGVYRTNDLRTEGHTVIHLNHQASSTRTALITFNIGDLHRKYGKNPAYFRVVNLDDPAYKQREVRIGVDGSLLSDFGKYVNSVTVTVRKAHEDGQTTLQEVVVNRETFAASPQGFGVVYGWHADSDRTAWLDYEYRTSWSFRDGGTHTEEWKKTDSPAINLLPPYERREVTIAGDLDALKKAGVRNAVVTLSYDFFGKPRSLRPVVLQIKDAQLEEKVELIQPRGDYRYRYDIRWHLGDGRDLAKAAVVDTSGLILVDEVPKG